MVQVGEDDDLNLDGGSSRDEDVIEWVYLGFDGSIDKIC